MTSSLQSQPAFDVLEAIVRRDPAHRGLASCRAEGRWLAAGGLEQAARELATHASSVAIVTGFCIPSANPAAAETDGPPGALYLARALAALGIETVFLSDRFGLPLLECGCQFLGLDAERIEVPLSGRSPPSNVADGTDWSNHFLDSPLGRRLTHLISIERAGPSHTPKSLADQKRPGPPPTEQFMREVPPEHRDLCHNMRGESIQGVTAPVHALFEAILSRGESINTIGIGDGGNEIGMGSMPWETLRAAMPGDRAGRTICRIATNHLILSGVSNWAAYGVACAVAVLRGRADILSAWGGAGQCRLIEYLVSEAGAVDGITGRREASVDGILLKEYSAFVDEIVEAARRL